MDQKTIENVESTSCLPLQNLTTVRSVLYLISPLGIYEKPMISGPDVQLLPKSRIQETLKRQLCNAFIVMH